jgi:RimJ/RimL family protein N-acetyltransferase
MKSNNKITVTSEEVPLIYLQSIEEDDVSDEYVRWLNDPIINQYLETRHSTQDLQSILAYVVHIQDNPNEHLFTIRLKENNKHVGNIKVGNINTHYNIAEISLFIGDKTVWGKGIATQAIQLISSFSIKKLKLRKLNAGAYEQNVASTKAFLNAGYTRDGVLRNHYIFKNQPCDLVQVCFFQEQVKHLPIITVYTSPTN